jgi:hypothetical protein
MHAIVSWLLTLHAVLVLVALGAAALAVLLFVLSRTRGEGISGRVVGPGSRGAVVYRANDAGDPRAPSFRIAVDGGGEREVLPRGAVLVSPWLTPHRRELRVGDRVAVDGLGVSAPRTENLYREAGCELALDALVLVRSSSRRAAALRAASATSLCLALLSMAGTLLPGLATHAGYRGELPAQVLAAARAATAAGIVCPRGARLVSERRDSDLPGFLHRCRMGEVDHGPFVERDATGFLRRSGNHLGGRREGSWLTQLPLDDQALLLRAERYRNGSRDGAYRELTRYSEEVTGTFCEGKRCGWWERRHDGELREAGTYVAGEKDGWWIEENGKGRYRHGKRQGAWILYDQRLELTQFSLLGTATVHCRTIDDRKHGQAFLRFADGRYASGRFRDDRPDGRWTVYSATGRMLLESELSGGVMLGGSGSRRAELVIGARAGQNPALAIGQNGSPP